MWLPLCLKVPVSLSPSFSTTHPHPAPTHWVYMWLRMHSCDTYCGHIVRLFWQGLHVAQVNSTKGKNVVCPFLTGQQQEMDDFSRRLACVFHLVPLYVIHAAVTKDLPVNQTDLSTCWRLFSEVWNHRDMLMRTNYLMNLFGSQILFWVYNCLLRYAELSV